MEKKELRRQMLLVRDRLSIEERRRRSQNVIEKLWQWEPFLQASRVCSYASFRSEVETDCLNERILREGKKLYLPRTNPDTHHMVFYPVEHMEELVDGYQGIREPREGEPLFDGMGKNLNCKEKQAGSIVMLMPGVAFDKEGNRIGYGGGYYDRYLSQYGGRIDSTCMLAFECQRVEKIEAENCDIRPDRILTEGR